MLLAVLYIARASYLFRSIRNVVKSLHGKLEIFHNAFTFAKSINSKLVVIIIWDLLKTWQKI